MLTDPVYLRLNFELKARRGPAPRDLIERLYLLEVAYAEAYWESRQRPLHGRASRPEAVGEWRHWLTRGGDWPLEPPPMPAVTAKARLQIIETEMHSPWHILAAIPPDAWKATGGTVGLAIVTRLRLVTRFVGALEDLAGLPGRVRNAALEQQLRSAQTHGLLAEAELNRLVREDAVADYEAARRRRLDLLAGDLNLPDTPEIDEPELIPRDAAEFDRREMRQLDLDAREEEPKELGRGDQPGDATSGDD